MIGILTFVGTQSHGACLQAYALQRKITEMGYEARIIPYQCTELKKEMDKRLPSAGGSLKKRAGVLARYPVIRDRYRKFAAFEKQYLGIEELAPSIDFSEFDRIIAGSDQIWNLEITGGDYTYFMEGIDPLKKATYAASIGTDSLSEQTEEKCLSLINEIPFINVREKNLKDYLEKKLPDKNIGLVLDPTQLIDSAEWKKLAGDKPIRRKKYMFVNFPAVDAKTWERIHEIARMKGLEVVFLTNQIKIKKGCRCIYSADPFEYLNLVRYADYVITGSFHTLSFSLLFERQFLCTRAMIGSRNSRLSSLLDLAGLSDRTLTGRWSDTPVDYEKAFHYFALGAFDGHLVSLYKIGDMYRNGYYVKKNEIEAFNIYMHCVDTMTQEEDIRKAVEVMRNGGVILYPTDTVWGIGCDATNAEAVKRVYEIKQRDDSKALICLVDSDARLQRYVRDVPDVAWQLIDSIKEGGKPTTLILDGAVNLAANLIAEDGSIGMRITQEPFSKELCYRFQKAIVSTSANISGEPAAQNYRDIDPKLLEAVDYVCTSRRQEKKPHTPSGIIRLKSDGEVMVVRK